jgi:hypothetical protein
MSNPPIEFHKQRELGELITDTFRFIKENFKPLFKVIFKVTGPVFFILLLAIGYYSYLGMDILENPYLISSMEMDMGTYFISLFIIFLSLMAFYVLLYGSVLHYIESYKNNAGKVEETEIYSGVKNDFGKLLGLIFIAGIITIAGLLLCVLPGVYLWVPMSLAPAILIFTKKPVFDAIGYAFDLIKNNWWTSFASLFIISLLVYIIGIIFQVPLTIYFFIKTLASSQETSVADTSAVVDWIYIFFNVVSSLFQYLLSVIIIVASAFIYYHLDEKKNATGSYQRISNLGSSETL